MQQLKARGSIATTTDSKPLGPALSGLAPALTEAAKPASPGAPTYTQAASLAGHADQVCCRWGAT